MVQNRVHSSTNIHLHWGGFRGSTYVNNPVPFVWARHSFSSFKKTLNCCAWSSPFPHVEAILTLPDNGSRHILWIVSVVVCCAIYSRAYNTRWRAARDLIRVGQVGFQFGYVIMAFWGSAPRRARGVFAMVSITFGCERGAHKGSGRPRGLAVWRSGWLICPPGLGSTILMVSESATSILSSCFFQVTFWYPTQFEVTCASTRSLRDSQKVTLNLKKLADFHMQLCIKNCRFTNKENSRGESQWEKNTARPCGVQRHPSRAPRTTQSVNAVDQSTVKARLTSLACSWSAHVGPMTSWGSHHRMRWNNVRLGEFQNIFK